MKPFQCAKAKKQPLIRLVFVYIAMMLSQQTSWAFKIFPVNIHKRITLTAMTKIGFSDCAASIVADADTGVDVLETLLGIGYSPAHHFDRTPADGSDDVMASRRAFDRGRFYLERMRLEIRLRQGNGDCKGAFQTLGDALHTLQDFFAHSNFVDELSPAEQDQTLLALEDTTQDPPANLRLACWDGLIPDQFSNDNDPTKHPYSHHDKNKDEPGRPYFDQARNQAITATSNFAQILVGGCKQSDVCGGNDKEVEGVTSGDPNDIAGSTGFGTPQWVSGTQPLPYTIFFANKPEATAPAQVVRVTSQLDLPGADLSTLSLGSITIGNQTITPEDHINPIAGVREYDVDVDLRPAKNLLVHVNAKLNLDNGLLTWTFTSINPTTGLPLAPDDPNGFLDPGQEGSMLFTVMPRKNLKTGTIVRNQASIVFDANAAMNTPIWFNTIDNDKPTSQVNKLAGVQNSLSFKVSWQGQDVGSGLRDFTIYVSDNGGAYTPWLTNTTDTSATFTGVGGHTYAFYSQARDNAFNLENAHLQPDTITQVANVAIDVSSQVSVTRGWFRLNKSTGRFVQAITLKNTGSSAVSGPVSLALDGLSSNAALFNKTGITSLVTPAGNPYLTVSAGDMAAGATVMVTLEFINSDSSKGITYNTRVLAGSGNR